VAERLAIDVVAVLCRHSLPDVDLCVNYRHAETALGGRSVPRRL
jgi:hypothetical protein